MSDYTLIKPGERFGRLVVLRVHMSGRRAQLVCQCDCGAESITRADDLRGARARSCGCLRGHNGFFWSRRGRELRGSTGGTR